MRPFNDACVATGMNIGSVTGPWGSVKREALALVVYRCLELIYGIEERPLTEHLATISKVKAGVLVQAMTLRDTKPSDY